ncbi:MAG: hypothetical protein MH252_14380 [Thermosynechococcaceae cyanobacterium MS004]|nr:hypothetical protein [Thermosynechococcaceae cyanobacterium MS004]
MKPNPLKLFLRKVLRHPYLQSPGNRGVVILILIFASIAGLFVIGTLREFADVANCKEQGGTPVYRENIQEFVHDGSGRGAPERVKYRVFDHCRASTPSPHQP